MSLNEISPKGEKKDHFDRFSVHLIGSVPGRHTGPDINKFGHLKLRQVRYFHWKYSFRRNLFRH